jgi:hypothetical protein
LHWVTCITVGTSCQWRLEDVMVFCY